jgi:2'-5' RNA ligase
MNIKYFGIITESRAKTAPYGCLMAMLPKEYAQSLVAFGRQIIKDQDLYVMDGEFGREKEPHVTIKYGFKPDLNEMQIRKLLKDIKPFNVEVIKLNQFITNPEYDVVKLTVESPILRELNKKCQLFPNMDEHPVYNQHITLAYVQKGKFRVGERNMKMIIPISTICYSPMTNEKSYYSLPLYSTM